MKKPLVSLIQRPRPVSSSSLWCHAMRSSRAWRSKIYCRKGRLKDKALSEVEEKDPFPRFYLFRSLVALNCCKSDKFWRQIVSDKFCPHNIRIARLKQYTCICATSPRKFQLLRFFFMRLFHSSVQGRVTTLEYFHPVLASNFQELTSKELIVSKATRLLVLSHVESTTPTELRISFSQTTRLWSSSLWDLSHGTITVSLILLNGGWSVISY